MEINRVSVCYCIYFFCASLGCFLTLLLFTSLNTQTTAVIESSPSFTTYTHLQVLYPNTLKCPCSNMIIPYHKLLSSSPTFHQICASDFLKDDWISLLLSIISSDGEGRFPVTDWRSQAYTQVQLLSVLCQLANSTATDAIQRFTMRSFVTSNLLTEIDFYAQLNATVAQFNQSTVADYSRPIDIIHLVTQVDQPYTGTISNSVNNVNAKLIVKDIMNETNGQLSPEVRICSKEKIFYAHPHSHPILHPSRGWERRCSEQWVVKTLETKLEYECFEKRILRVFLHEDVMSA